MQRHHHIGVAVAVCATAAACAGADRLAAPSSTELAGRVGLHVGYKGSEVAYGFVSGSAECHVGKKGNRWPLAEQWEVKVYDARLVVTPSGRYTLVCEADFPATLPNGDPLVPPAQAEVEQAVLCFLPAVPGVPGAVETRDAQEVFTPSGRVVLTCHYNPRQRAE